eukprot:2880029-Alexandrium_andersonii.AAC.1
MTRDEFRLALQNYVEWLRAADWAHQGNVTHGFGQAASAHLTVTYDISGPFRAALIEAWQS